MVILDVKDYINKANRQLNDTNNYKQLDFALHNEKKKIRNKQLKKWQPLDFKNRNLSFKKENYTTWVSRSSKNT